MNAQLPNSEQCEHRAAVFKAFAHPSRVLIADALSHGELCVCELTELIGADMSTVSKHLSVMKASGLLRVEKRQRNIYYSLACPCLPEFFRCVDTIHRDHVTQLQQGCC